MISTSSARQRKINRYQPQRHSISIAAISPAHIHTLAHITMLSTIAACLALSVSATIIHRDRFTPSSPYRYLLYTAATVSSLYLLTHFNAEPWAHLLYIAASFLYMAIFALCRRYMYRRISRDIHDRVPGRRSGLTMRIKIPRVG